LKILIIGAGLIGQERLLALENISRDYSKTFETTVVDTNNNLLEEIKKKFNVNVNTNYIDELAKNPDWVFISTPHSVAPGVVIDSFKSAKNILVEKPLGRSLDECNRILEQKPDNVTLHVGLNYRFYQGINLLLNHVQKNLFGDLISVNMILGHGNSPGMENSWKLDPEMAGGGCLLDPGVHLLDLALLIANSQLKVKGGSIWKGFWKTGVEEEAHIILESESNITFNIQTSLNRWRSNFHLEVNGTKGYGIITGRGRSYGKQTYKTGKRWGWESGISQAESETYHIKDDAGDDSFYECMLGLFSIPSWKIRSSEVYPCDHVAGKKIMTLLKECRNQLELKEPV
jgi:predicted dehydrogenase